jgi:peptide deformylase
VAAVEDDAPYPPSDGVINPEITVVGTAWAEDWEGCLRDVRGRVPRATDILVKALDRTGARFELRALDFLGG